MEMYELKEEKEEEEDMDGDEFVGYNEWAARELGVVLCTDFVYDTDEASGERGVFVAEDIAPQTAILRLPFDSLLTVHWMATQQHHELYPRVLRQLSLTTGAETATSQEETALLTAEEDALAIALLYERFVAQQRSSWAPHVALLPPTYHNLLYFAPHERALLRGSNLLGIATQMTHKLEEDHTRVVRLLSSILAHDKEEKEVKEEEEEEVSALLADVAQWCSLANYQWAVSTIWSRFVSLQVDTRKQPLLQHCAPAVGTNGTTTIKAMAPVFDMLNHDPHAEVAHALDPATNCLQLVSHQHWAAGTQIFINYGAVSNHKLLTLYGFVLPENPFNAVEMWLPMADERHAKDALFQAKVAALARMGVDHECTPFRLTADGVDEVLLMAVRVQELTSHCLEEFDRDVDRVLNGEVVSLANEEATLTRLIFTVKRILQAYDTAPAVVEGARIESQDLASELLEHLVDDDEEEDEEEKKEENEDGGGGDLEGQSLHTRLARVLVASDKRILCETIEMLKWRLLDVLATKPTSP